MLFGDFGIDAFYLFGKLIHLSDALGHQLLYIFFGSGFRKRIASYFQRFLSVHPPVVHLNRKIGLKRLLLLLEFGNA